MNIEPQVMEIYVSDIIPNRFQPRLSFNEQKLNELAQSIRQHGIIQPLVLRKTGDKYEIIAGERRYKAAVSIGLNKVPAIITDLDDNQSAEIALVENLQRKDLTSIEEARSYKKLLDRGYLTQEQLAEKMGISQSTIANKIRLLNLSEEAQDALLYEKISERHARSLLAVTNKEEQIYLLNKIQAERLTVRQLDREIEKLKGGKADDLEKMEKIEQTEIFELPKTIIDAPPTFEVEKPAVEVIEEVLPQELIQQETNNNMSNIDGLLNNKEPEPVNFFSQPNQQPEVTTQAETSNVFNFPSFEELSVIPEGGNNEQQLNEKNPQPQIVTETPQLDSVPENAQTIQSFDQGEKFNIDNMFSSIANSKPVTEAKPVMEGLAQEIEKSANVALTNIQDAINDLKTGVENPQPQFVTEEPKPEPIQEVKLKIDKSNFRTVEAAFENLKQEIIAAGLKIDMDTYNFEQYYQLIIKIYK